MFIPTPAPHHGHCSGAAAGFVVFPWLVGVPTEEEEKEPDLRCPLV